MPKINLTDQAVRKLKPPAKGQIDVYDAGYPGLCLRIGSGGTKVWYHQRRVGGKLQRRRLGDYPKMGVAGAHDAWRTSRDDVTAIKSGAKPMPPPSRDAIERVVADWLKRDQAENASHDEVKRIMERDVVKEWRGRLITSIGKREILELIDGIADEGKMAKARLVYRYLHRMFRWAAGRDIIDASPMADMTQPGENVRRDRVLSDVEIVAFWRACKAIAYPFGPLGQILLLTAARRTEVGELRWDEVNIADRQIKLPAERTKNGEAHIIPLSPLASHILRDGPRIQGSPYVFSTTGATPVSGWAKMKTALDREMRINESWRLHDLRRTAATGLEALGVPLQTTEAILNHVSGSKAGVAGIYQRYKHEPEKRAALDRWSARVLELVAA